MKRDTGDFLSFITAADTRPWRHGHGDTATETWPWRHGHRDTDVFAILSFDRFAFDVDDDLRCERVNRSTSNDLERPRPRCSSDIFRRFETGRRTRSDCIRFLTGTVNSLEIVFQDSPYRMERVLHSGSRSEGQHRRPASKASI